MIRILHHLGSRSVAALYRIESPDRVCHILARSMSAVQNVNKNEESMADLSKKNKAPMKFTRSEAYLNYRSTDNFYGGDDRFLPDSHNYVLAGSLIFSFYYLIFLRDDIEADGGKGLMQPLHETVPSMAIPLLQAAIAENKKFGFNTEKLEKKLEELMKEPEKHGAGARKLIEN